ncbi:MAG: hypothetical protein U0359_04620 [Byssovorax sp.]
MKLLGSLGLARSLSFSALLLSAACGGKVIVDGSNGVGGGGSTGAGGGGPSACGAVACAADEYCDYPDDACGEGAAGVCKARPPFCDDSGPAVPVCGCNGKVYSYACDAALAGQDNGPNDACKVTSTFFSCGPVNICDGTQSYCQRSVSDVGGEPDGWACINFPACGGQTGCSCVTMEPCGEFCATDDAGHVTVTCPGG